MPEEDKAVAGSEHQAIIPCKEEDPDVTEEKIYIPDYVMQDFGFFERTRVATERCSLR